MAYLPHATSFEALYKLTSADGLSIASFNNPTDPFYVGALTEVTGLDSADVRESANDLTEADGGDHGNFYFGRRPITMTGLVFGHASVTEREQRLDRARRASLALRGDSSLTWRPASRQENLVANPAFNVDSSKWVLAQVGTGGSLTRISSWGTSGRVANASLRVTGSASAGGGYIGAEQGLTVAADRMPVSPGKSYFFRADFNAITNPNGIGVLIYWFSSAGALLGQSNGITSFTGTGVVGTKTGVVTAPASAYSAAVMPYAINLGGSAATVDFYVDGIMFGEGTAAPASYFDGDTAGYYWNGATDNSSSGDFIEKYVPVRRQQPFRESGQWNKSFQIALVSKYATIFSSQVKTLSTGTASENRGNYPAYPVVSIIGTSSNPTISDGTRTFRTTGLTLASGETIQIDFFTHFATFTAGARVGQNANRYIDWATTEWPYFSGLGTSQTMTLTGGGSATLSYRDAWA